MSLLTPIPNKPNKNLALNRTAKRRMRTLTLVALGFGLASVGALFLAIATDYWLFTSEPVDFEKMILGGQSEISKDEFPPDTIQGFDDEVFLNESVPMIFPTAIKIHSGLWRVCVYYEDLGE